jgi:2-iminobutanoate/2-iminopropanoate deaminase
MSDVKRISTPYTYSSAVAAGDYVFLGLHRGSGDTFSAQLKDAFTRLEETLKEVGLTLADLVKVHVWLKSIEDLPEMEQRFGDIFEDGHFPARMTSTTEFIDDDCLVMIEGTAYAADR